MQQEPGGERYLVISADCHAGGSMPEYRTYLERRYHDDYEAVLIATCGQPVTASQCRAPSIRQESP